MGMAMKRVKIELEFDTPEIHDVMAKFDAISNMIDAATPHGLLVEVLYSYTIAIRNGATVAEAAFHGMNDWDV
jgi:hypothetical protein